ncbi:TraX family protein [Peptoniphilus asaccharolyticus]
MQRKKYLLNLIIFALISEIPYDMFILGIYFESSIQNMFSL